MPPGTGALMKLQICPKNTAASSTRWCCNNQHYYYLKKKKKRIGQNIHRNVLNSNKKVNNSLNAFQLFNKANRCSNTYLRACYVL